MPRIVYEPKRFTEAHQKIIQIANDICVAYERQGFTLTLRQLFYQFVSRGYIPNTHQDYKRLGVILNKARLAGEFDWNHMEDRTRNVRVQPTWESPQDMVSSIVPQYREDKWASQDVYIEAWVEKDALVGVLQQVCSSSDIEIPYFSCRGYTSQSEVWGASRRILRKIREGKRVIVLHLGDHDPSGVDMTRDIEERLTLFIEHEGYDAPTIRRLALNMDQVRQFNPPPNPAKMTDTRIQSYVDRYGYESWELDALEPTVIANLIRNNVLDERDEDLWARDTDVQEDHRQVLEAVATRLEEEEGYD